jgi:hypothetical protein
MPRQRPHVECDEGRNAGIERRITKLFEGEPHVGARPSLMERTV